MWQAQAAAHYISHKEQMSRLACKEGAMACSHELQLGRHLGVQGRQAHIQRHWRELRLGMSVCSMQQCSSLQDS